MNAVMARILGLAGSGGAFRWAFAGEMQIRATQRREEKRMVPRRMVGLQLGRSIAAPLQDTGFGVCGVDCIERRYNSTKYPKPPHSNLRPIYMMKTIIIMFLFAPPLFAQDDSVAARAAAGCGSDQVNFDVKSDKKQHP